MSHTQSLGRLASNVSGTCAGVDIIGRRGEGLCHCSACIVCVIFAGHIYIWCGYCSYMQYYNHNNKCAFAQL